MHWTIIVTGSSRCQEPHWQECEEHGEGSRDELENEQHVGDEKLPARHENTSA